MGVKPTDVLSAPFTTGPFPESEVKSKPRWRRTLSGLLRPFNAPRRELDFGHLPTKAGSVHDPGHPSRKHDTDLAPSYVQVHGHEPPDPTSRRRDRRPVSRYVASQERKARRRAAPRE